MKGIFITTSHCREGTGGGIVSLHESKALDQFCDETTVIDASIMETRPELDYSNPFTLDYLVSLFISNYHDLVHFNGNPWRQTLKTLRYFNPDIKVVSSVPAHNLQKSIMEHKKLGIPHEKLYPHLHVPELWRKYVEHVNKSDLVITPSKLSEKWLMDLPYMQEGIATRVIPHGCVMPDSVPPFPEEFTPAYFGVDGPDKGTHLLPDSVKKFGKDFNDDYDNLYALLKQISVGVFPSVTEAFNICALECMAYGRPIVVSKYAGISEIVEWGKEGYCAVPKKNFKSFECGINTYKLHTGYLWQHGINAREKAKQFSWDKIELQYQEAYETVF